MHGHVFLMCFKSPIEWRQRPDMTIAVEWDVKHRLKQTNKQNITVLENSENESCLYTTCKILKMFYNHCQIQMPVDIKDI